MKPLIRHFHSNPRHHGTRYYLGLAACLLIPGLAYVLWTLMAARF
ncbi:hypothetical protein [Cupriavidus basilensis]|nr:hypothetical protein [Cupriavidus basilensis]